MKKLFIFALLCASCGSYKTNEPDTEPVKAHQDSMVVIPTLNMDELTK